MPRNERERMFLAQQAETRQTLISKFRYPLGSQPLALKTDMLMPHHVEPLMRALSTEKGDGKLRVEQNQSRVYLRPGQTAVASFKILYEGHPTNIDIQASNLTREANGPAPEAKVASIAFHDDGVAPDEIGGDGVYTAIVATPSDNPPCGMNLFVDLASNGESGRLVFPFIQTGPEPAKFTHEARVALEDGSVVFYAGITVEQPGLFEILGRVYDSTGAPAVLCRFHDQLTTDTREIRLVAYGKVLLDEGAVPPLTLRDLEGWRFSLGQYPDRDLMDDWEGGVVSPAYSIGSFTQQSWNGPDLQSQLEAFDTSTAAGLANLQAQPGP
jgi:hypothetical protein